MKNNEIKEIFLQDRESERVDLFLSRVLSLSRTYGAKLVEDAVVYKNGILVTKPSVAINLNDTITIIKKTSESLVLKDITIEIPIVHEEEDFIVINKPAGISVHKANAGDISYTIADWVKEKGLWSDEYRELNEQAREGIVHRLDKNTSGLLLIAKNPKSHELLSKLFMDRVIKKQYKAVVEGEPPVKKTIKTEIIRDPLNPTRMCCAKGRGKHAITHITLEKQYDNYALVVCDIETGRTHQIRVHMAHIGHPVIGDEIYGKKSNLINRQALHACLLEFVYGEKKYSFISELPLDINLLLV